jgi:hypothetical protein
VPKVAHWERHLAEYVESQRNTPFRWGEFDCAIFAREALAVQYGEIVVPHFAGRYKTAKGAARFLRSFFDADSLQTALSRYMIEIDPRLAQRGDIVSIRDDSPIEGVGEALGVCMGSRLAVTTLAGVAYIDRSSVDRAWRLEK